ncbi:hypothetical protein BLA29_001464 [Euroglyphus maynei]|uniref:Uncharacterized protein n=1 Tax=Euroglyphus maynei TaxID=6958 RepID=A0A1Y3BAU1_EURMA|nr:hypothetical protein BLA29_001464 [Euroglyphus maynei]
MVWFDTYSAGISLIASAMFETLAVMYIYGAEKFCLDIESMIGHRPSRYFVYSWKYISPVFLTTIIIMSIINSESISYYGYNFPLWATISGWCFTLSSISFIPIYALFYYIRNHYRKSSSLTSTTLIKNDKIKMKNSNSKIGHSSINSSKGSHDMIKQLIEIN